MPQKRFIHSTVARFSLFLLILAGCWALGRFFHVDKQFYQDWISQYPPVVAAGVFIFLYVGVTFFAWLAKDIFKIVGAVLFGAYLSTLYIWIAEMFNAVILFHLSRKLGRDFVSEKLGFTMASAGGEMRASGFWTIFALRAVPLVPYRFLDLFCGLTRISFAKYFLIVVFGSPLRIFWIQLILAAVGEAVFTDPLAVMDYFIEHRILFIWSLAYAVGAVLIILFWNKKKGGEA